MSRLAELQKCSSLRELALLLRLKPSALAFVVYKIPDAQKYTRFAIIKKSGGVRDIHAPTERLKLVQRRLADLLADCLREIETSQQVNEACAISHGYHNRRSTYTGARRHRNRRFVLNLDLKDFFPSMNFGRVQGYFAKNAFFRLEPKIATVIAQIACYQGVLPQGSPASPIVSNLIANVMDMHLSDFAARSGCTYTRYADDLSFSTNKKAFPCRVGRESASQGGGWTIGDGLSSRIWRSGFAINPCKTRVQYQSSRQEVTGLVVNKNISPPSEYIRLVRAMAHHMMTTNTAYRSLGPDGPAKHGQVSIEQISGMLSYIHHIKSSDQGFRRAKTDREEPGFVATHRRLLDYKAFWANARIAVLTEGETDVIYLRGALKQLKASFPTLRTIVNGLDVSRVHLVKYSKLTNSVQRLNGGVGDLGVFIRSYAKRTTGFMPQAQSHPTIILIDADQGAAGIYKAVADIAQPSYKVDGSHPFYHVVKNLYVVMVPRVTSGHIAIEDLFEASMFSIPLSGKIYHAPGKGFDPALHFGKAAFAKNVVASLGGKVNYSGFAPLLKAFADVLDDFSARKLLGQTV